MPFANGQDMTGQLLSVAALAALLTASCGDESSNLATGPSSARCTTLPAAPSNLRVTSIVRTTVEVTWNAVPGATGYTLMVGSTPGGTDELLSDTSQTFMRFTARDGRSFARVQANNPCGGGPATGSIEFFVPG